MKKVLLLCASHNDLGLVRALRKLGVYIIATGNAENAPGIRFVDKYIKADYSDKDLILHIAQQEKIDAVCQCCNDFGVYTASYVAEKLGLSGYDSYETTLTLHNKDRFKEFASCNGIITPQTVSFVQKEAAIAALKTVQYPIIVKPTDASAGNGIQKATNDAEAINAIDKAFEKSRAKKIVIEPFIEGTQHGFCTFLKNKKVVAVCSNNEYSFLNPYRVEIDTFPADNYTEVASVLIEQIEKIADKLNLCDGIFHLQYIFKDGKPWIIEVMRRILGNMYHVPGNMLTGIDWEYWETRAKIGLSLENFPQHITQEGFFAYKTVVSSGQGVIKNITVPFEYEQFVYDDFYLHQTGDTIVNYKNDPIGFLFMMFPDMQKMKQVLIDNYRCDLVEVTS